VASDLAALLVAAVVTTVTMPMVIRFLQWRQVLDVPNVRSSHTIAVPRGGGLAVVLGSLVGAVVGLIADGSFSVQAVILLMAAAGFAALGLADDLYDVGAIARLVFQLVGAVAVSGTLTVVARDRPSALLVLAILGTLWIVAFVNAFNFMDGVNAISGVTAALAGAWFGAWAGHDGDVTVAVVSWALVGAAIAFLPWNAPRARVFLGDVGSYGIGALLAMLAFVTWLRTHDAWVALAPLAVYLADTAFTMMARAQRGEPLLKAHRSHVYQRLTNHGLSHLGSTTVVAAASVVICLLVAMTSGAVLVLLVGLTLVAYLGLPRMLAVAVRA